MSSLFSRVMDSTRKVGKQIRDGLTRPNMDCSVLLLKDVYFLGENIKGTIILETHEYVEVEQALVGISCVENVKKIKNVKKTKQRYDRWRRQTITVEENVPEKYWEKSKIHNEKIRYNLNYRLNSGQTNRTPFEINIPLTGRPTFKSVDQVVNWSLDVEIKSKGRRSLQQQLNIQVARPQPGQIPTLLQKETIKEIEVIYCRHCGTKNNARSANCTHCGAPIH